jgi:hypothetical protein
VEWYRRLADVPGVDYAGSSTVDRTALVMAAAGVAIVFSISMVAVIARACLTNHFEDSGSSQSSHLTTRKNRKSALLGVHLSQFRIRQTHPNRYLTTHKLFLKSRH